MPLTKNENVESSVEPEMEWSGPGKDTGPGYLRKNILQNKLGYMFVFGDKLSDMHEYTMGNMHWDDVKYIRR